jgi:UDP-GlcNAc:undecaprenyl-phosphate/decaprenyl-phosphate GlcNAc-1-phosphate transferase
LSYSINFIVAYVSCFIALWVFGPFALKARLVDCPDHRKTHEGEIPLIGGLAMFVGFVISLLVSAPDLNQVRGILIGSSIIVTVGVLDDHQNISVRARFILQIAAVLIMTSLSGIVLSDLGNLIGTGELPMGGWAIPFTVVAAVGAMNAMNMIDGIDGLAASTALVCFVAVLFLYLLEGESSLKPILFVGVLLPFLWRNLSSLKKVFMGDAGSMFLGFGVVWVVIEASQGEAAVMSPVTALWIFAVPLIDTVAIMFRRMLKGQSPFLADRGHLHHIFLRAGFSDRSTLYIMSSLAAVFASIGILGHISQVPEWLMLVGFMIVFIIYLWGIRHAWTLLKYARENLFENTLNTTKSARKLKKRVSLGMTAFFLSMYIAFFLYSPNITVNAIKQSMQQKKTDGIENYIDFTAIQHSLKAQLKAELILKASDKKTKTEIANPFFMAMISESTKMVEDFIELFISKNGLSRLFEMDMEHSISPQATEARKVISVLRSVTNFNSNDTKFLSYNTIQLKVGSNNGSEHSLVFTFKYFRWVLTDIIIDLRDVDDKKIINFISYFQQD